MPQHLEDDELDRYSLGAIPEAELPDFEEHLLLCAECRSRLAAADEFAGLFRAAASQPEAAPRRRQSTFRRPAIAWPVAAVLAAGLCLVVVSLRDSSQTPSTVYLNALRGPESSVHVTAGKPLEVVFDVEPSDASAAYEARVADSDGREFLRVPPHTRDRHLAVHVQGLGPGMYWVRLYRKGNGELLAEYGVESK